MSKKFVKIDIDALADEFDEEIYHLGTQPREYYRGAFNSLPAKEKAQYVKFRVDLEKLTTWTSGYPDWMEEND